MVDDPNRMSLIFVYTIAASSLTAISIWSIPVITVSCNWVESFSISSGFDPSDVFRIAPDVTWNSSWPTWKSFYSFPGRLLENPDAPVEEADVGDGDIFAQADGASAAVKDGAAIITIILIDSYLVTVRKNKNDL